MAQRCTYCGRTRKQHKKPCVDIAGFIRVLAERQEIKDGETVCEHGNRPFECGICYPIEIPMVL